MFVTGRVGFGDRHLPPVLRNEGLFIVYTLPKGGDFRGSEDSEGASNAKPFRETKTLGKSGEWMKHALKQVVVIPLSNMSLHLALDFAIVL
jgi:hypothetical protein